MSNVICARRRIDANDVTLWAMIAVAVGAGLFMVSALVGVVVGDAADQVCQVLTVLGGVLYMLGVIVGFGASLRGDSWGGFPGFMMGVSIGLLCFNAVGSMIPRHPGGFVERIRDPEGAVDGPLVTWQMWLLVGMVAVAVVLWGVGRLASSCADRRAKKRARARQTQDR